MGALSLQSSEAAVHFLSQLSFTSTQNSGPMAGKAAPLKPKPGLDASPAKPRDGSVQIEIPKAIILVKSSMPGSHQRAQALLIPGAYSCMRLCYPFIL